MPTDYQNSFTTKLSSSYMSPEVKWRYITLWHLTDPQWSVAHFYCSTLYNNTECYYTFQTISQNFNKQKSVVYIRMWVKPSVL